MVHLPLELATHLFSCQELKCLRLYDCHFHPIPRFRGFPNLFTLDMCLITVASYICGEFLTQCSLLEYLKHRFSMTDNIKETEIAKLENLKVLSLTLGKDEHIDVITKFKHLSTCWVSPQTQRA